MASLKIKKGDYVVVTAGKDKGKGGEVLKILPAENRAIVQGVNNIKRHQRQTPQQDGGIRGSELAPVAKIHKGSHHGIGANIHV